MIYTVIGYKADRAVPTDGEKIPKIRRLLQSKLFHFELDSCH